MEESILTKIIMPLCIIFIMYGLGLSLTIADFRRVWTNPKVMSIVIALQIIGFPALGFMVCYVLRLEPVLAASVGTTSSASSGPPEKRPAKT